MSFVEVKRLKRLGADERGWVVEPVDDSDLTNRRILNLHVVCAEPGSVRGNHFHRDRRESICVLGGSFQFSSVDNASGERFELNISSSESVCVTVASDVSHAMKNVGSEAGYLLCFSDKPFNPQRPDTVKNTILE